MRSKIELRHLRYIIAAAEYGSFRQAGRSLGVEQSAISRGIGEVEDEIGDRLFRRHSHGVELSELGRQFLADARQGTEQISAALENARSVTATHWQLRVGVFGPLTMTFLSELFAAFRRAHPGTKLQFSEGSSAELIAAVRRRQLDVGVVAEASPGNGYKLLHLWNEPVFLAMPTSDPLARQTTLRWEDIRDRHFVVTDLPTGKFAKRYLNQNLGARAADHRIEQLAVTRESLMQIVAHGGGVSIASSAHIRLGISDIAFRLIEDAVLRFDAVHAWGSVHRDVQRLLALARSLSESNSPLLRQAGLYPP